MDSMTDMPEKSSISSRMCGCISRLCSMRVKDSMDISIEVAPPEGAPCLTKRIKSDGEFMLMKGLGMLLAVGAALSLLCLFCSLCSRAKR